MSSETVSRTDQKDHTQKPQKLSFFRDAVVIAMVDFPIYFLTRLTSRHFFVAGGGGASKTGVINQINLFELIPEEFSCAAKLTLKFETPSEVKDAIMSAALMEDAPVVNNRLIAAGDPPYLYSIAFNLFKQTFCVESYKPFNKEKISSPVKCVKCMVGKLMTGGEDGKLTVWSTFDDEREPFKTIKAHSKEIDEIDINPSIGKLVTLCRSEVCSTVWDIESLKLIHKFDSSSINNQNKGGPKFIFRSCRFVQDKGNSLKYNDSQCNQQSYLLTICNKAKANSKLFKWSMKSFKEEGSVEISEESVMAFNVDPSGCLVGLGTLSGSVLVYGIASLSKVYKFSSAHSNLVTQLEFLPSEPESLLLTDSHKFALISTSIDRRVILHRPTDTYKNCGIPILIFALLNGLIALILRLFIQTN